LNRRVQRAPPRRSVAADGRRGAANQVKRLRQQRLGERASSRKADPLGHPDRLAFGACKVAATVQEPALQHAALGFKERERVGRLDEVRRGRPAELVVADEIGDDRHELERCALLT
jgi:hypothetical protein